MARTRTKVGYWINSKKFGWLMRYVAGLLSISSGFLAGPGWAADTSTQPGLSEIIVTAQKREQNLQDVPIAVIAVSAQQLRDAGVTDIKNLQVLTPGLTVTSTTSENVTTARIRGIGTVGDNPGLESSVGVVIDGVYRPRNGVGFGDLGELDRIEILEGPQGELFGKNNDAGVINIVTKRPSRTFGVDGEVTYGNYDDREISGSITGPLGAVSALRLYAGYQRRDGFSPVDTGLGPNTDGTSNNRNYYTARGQYLLTPTEDVSFLLIGDYTKRNENCCDAVPVDNGIFSGVINGIAGTPILGGKTGTIGLGTPPLSPFNQQAWANQPITQRIRDMGISGQLDWDLHFAKLTSITAWRDNTIYYGNDSDYSGVDIIYTPDSGVANMTDFKQASEELRLAGEQGPLNWLVGGFFSSEILTPNTTIYAGDNFEEYVGGAASVVGPLGPAGFDPFLIPMLTHHPLNGTFIPGVSGEQDQYRQTSKSYAFFTNETYRITPLFDLTAGLRFTSEKKTATSNFSDPDGGGGCGSLLTAPGVAALTPTQTAFLLGYGCSTVFNSFFNGVKTSQSLSEGNVSGTIKLSYHLTDDVMSYISWANGYKAGGFNLSRVANTTTLAPELDTEFPRETVESYEIGLKSLLADRTVRLNISVFDEYYTNFQLNTYTGIQFVVSSVRRVQSKGVELTDEWATPLSGLSLSSGVTYAFTNINEFGESAALFAPDVATPLNRLNNRLSFAPLWSGVASATYTVPIDAALSLHGNINEKYSSSYNTGSDLNPEKIQGAYGLLNGRLGIGAPDGKWTVEIWGDNLANKGYYQVAFDAPFQYEQVDAFLGAPRTYGVTFRAKL
jgi:iron complex outermembrane recepter protein